MSIEVNVTVNVHTATGTDVLRVERKVVVVYQLLQKILAAVVTDPAKLAELNRQLQENNEALEEMMQQKAK